MKRDLNKLSQNKFDLLIIGGGIYGATLLWRAAVAGYSAALVEQNDFGSGTSSNSQKIIHGGLRYLQNLDFLRIRQSVNERKRLLWLAPHLVSPLPCIMPLYGHKIKGKEALSIAVKLYDLISADRNKIHDKSKFIPNGKILNKKEIVSLLPGIDQKSLKGGVLWYDAFCNNTERLIISFIKSAVNFGSSAANYIKAEKLIIENNTIKGAWLLDKQSEELFQVKAEKVIACTGPERNDFCKNLNIPEQKYIAGLNVIVKKIFSHDFAVGIENNINKRLYFVAPWKDKTILGTDWYLVPESGKFEFKKIHVRKLIENFNEIYPAANLTFNDVEFVHHGFVPAADDKGDLISTLSHFKIIDAENYGLKGFYKLVGVKYTTAVNVAETLLKVMFPGFKKLPLQMQPRLSGGEIEYLEEFKNKIYQNYGKYYSKQKLENLLYNYGSEINEILNRVQDEFPSFNDHFGILKTEIIYAIKEEMALHLDDIIIRRTELGSSGIPCNQDLEFVSKIMSEELNWDESARIQEINRVKKYYSLINVNPVYKQNMVT